MREDHHQLGGVGFPPGLPVDDSSVEAAMGASKAAAVSFAEDADATTRDVDDLTGGLTDADGLTKDVGGAS